MKAVVTHKGSIELIEMEIPDLQPHFVLVETCYSAISTGTEMLLHQNNPQVPTSLGYSAMGIVREIDSRVDDFQVGQYVACYGGPYVRHAEWLAVPRHLAAPFGADVNGEEAAFGGLGAIAIHAIRQTELQFGERVIVVGLGILGQIICQVANAAAYDVIGFDLSPSRCELLQQSGGAKACASTEQVDVWLQNGLGGADAVIICTGGKQAGLIDQALGWIRDRGTIVIIGDVNVECDRDLMFRKEARIVISRAGGPGRYDDTYERLSVDYPIGYVRWTEGRNLREYIRLLETGRVSVAPLITDRFRLSQMEEAYAKLLEHPFESIGVLIDYGKSLLQA